MTKLLLQHAVGDCRCICSAGCRQCCTLNSRSSFTAPSQLQNCLAYGTGQSLTDMTQLWTQPSSPLCPLSSVLLSRLVCSQCVHVQLSVEHHQVALCHLLRILHLHTHSAAKPLPAGGSSCKGDSGMTRTRGRRTAQVTVAAEALASRLYSGAVVGGWYECRRGQQCGR